MTIYNHKKPLYMSGAWQRRAAALLVEDVVVSGPVKQVDLGL